ncbi:MAG: hypothetical protein H0X17_04475 [Deltaproteobacteria bacterium]|nr:hypothetical protein [Deltaproteobacteria bacterium]
MRSLRFLVVISLVASFGAPGCGSPVPAGHVRFANQPAVWRVNDRTLLPKAPAERDYNRALYHLDGFFIRRATRAMDVPDPVRARDTNALDEVPDSTWFTNRIGVRELSLDELRSGPNDGNGPLSHLPWKIVSGKSGGTAIGFVIEDSRGDKYLMKFDLREVPEMETGAHVLGHRILWACGFNVPQDYVGYIRREDLVIAPDATRKDVFGKKTPLRASHVDSALERVYRTDDGRIRVLASKFLPGKPIGPVSREGIRRDDPNDLFPHEQRRTLRGQLPIFSWLGHTDLQEDNTLDVFVKAEGEQDRGHVMHYLIDFGKAFGVMAYGQRWKTVGYTYRIDLGTALKTLVSLGLWDRPWEDVGSPPYRGVGLYDPKHYDPGLFRANSQWWPVQDADRFDAFWGAKLLIRFTREQLAAIVEQAGYTDPRASQYMLDALVERQRKTARYWFDQVSAVDQFRVEPQGLCFDDLTLRYDLRRVATRYHVEAFDHDGRATGFQQIVPAGPGGRACTTVTPSGSPDGYTIVRLRVQRNAQLQSPVVVHLARDAAGSLRVIGIRRE